MLSRLWNARELIAQFVLRDLTARYAQTVMGFAWALLLPVLVVCTGLVFRFATATAAGGTLDGLSIASLAIKALPWAFFSGAVSVATQSVLSHANLIGKVNFPRETLPLASVLAQGVDSLIALTAVLVLLPFLGVAPHWTLLWVPILLGLLFLFTCGCALLLSCANLFFRDVKYLVQVFLNFGMFATPIFIEPPLLGERGARVLLALPLSPFIQGVDMAGVRGFNLLQTIRDPHAPGVVLWSPWHLTYAVVLAVGTLAIGLVVFRKGSRRFAEVA